MSMKRFTLTFNITAGDRGKTVRDFLREKDISRTALTDIKFKGGNITVNGTEVRVRRILEKGDILAVTFPEEKRSESIKGELIPLDILYEDEYLLVINKPPGMNTIPSREHSAGSLANAVAGYYEKIGLHSTVHVVTRLDRDTSGVVLIAKYRHIHHLFSRQHQEGNIVRIYEALAGGKFSRREGLIEEPIARKTDSIIEREVNPDGQYACTYFEVIKQYPAFAHVRLRPKTGWTHQIRVHLSHLGHPLLGDDLYGGTVNLIGRQALHCRSISFFHPVLQKNCEFEAPLPADMEELLEPGGT